MTIKTSFKNARVIAPLHTSGPVALTPDGTRLFTCVDAEARMTDASSGGEISRFEGDSTSITSMAIAPSSTHLVIFYMSLFFRVYDVSHALGDSFSDASSSQTPLVQPSRVIPKSHDAPVHVCRIDPSSTLLASGSADGVVKVWDFQRGYVTHQFRGHGGVISALAFNYPRETRKTSATSKDDTLQLITGSVDTRIRLFDLSAPSSQTANARATAVLDGHASAPRGLDVSPDGRWLISGGRDSVVLIWDLYSRNKNTKPSIDGSTVSVAALSNVGSATLFKTVPVFERVESAGFIQSDTPVPSSSSESSVGRIKFFTGGDKGCIRVWDAWEGKVIATYGHDPTTGANSETKSEESREILDIIYTASKAMLTSVHADQNILTFSINTGTLARQYIGFNDEIIDCRLLHVPSASILEGGMETHVALATNSSLIKVYNRETLDVRLLPSLDSPSSGHSGMVLCLDSIPSAPILVSGSKDRTARVWTVKSSTSSTDTEADWACVGLAEGHTESIGAIALARKLSGDTTTPPLNRLSFMFTGSQDRTLKMWDLSILSKDSSESQPVRIKSLWTHKAHDKDINALDVSHNNQYLATASQDKMVNIFEITYLSRSSVKGHVPKGEARLIGTCKGHRRGVWDVKFHKNSDRMVATASSDKTVKLWDLGDFSCLKTFEGHVNTVLRVHFMSEGMQLVSSASDGLVKLWNIREEECVASLDNHEAKIWALAVSQDESTIVSGAADSVVTFWEDCTEELELEVEAEKVNLALKEQDYMNYVALKDYRSAILLALSMDQPGRLFNLFKTLRIRATTSDSPVPDDAPSVTGNAAVDRIIQTLPFLELARLLTLVRNWNANARTSVVAQTVLHAILKLKSADDIAKAFEHNLPFESDSNNSDAPTKVPKATLKGIIDGLIPYTERHFARADQLVHDSYVMDFILGEMDMGLLGDDKMELDVVD